MTTPFEPRTLPHVPVQCTAIIGKGKRCQRWALVRSVKYDEHPKCNTHYVWK